MKSRKISNKKSKHFLVVTFLVNFRKKCWALFCSLVRELLFGTLIGIIQYYCLELLMKNRLKTVSFLWTSVALITENLSPVDRTLNSRFLNYEKWCCDFNEKAFLCQISHFIRLIVLMALYLGYKKCRAFFLNLPQKS